MSKQIGRVARWWNLALCLAVAVGAASCGSGAVSDPGPAVAAGPISITPATATLYSGLPTTFVVSGGNGLYVATSSDQNVLPVVTAFEGNAFTVVPNAVAADTPVTLTVRDTGTTAPASAALTVKPRTISNLVTITPSSSQSAACGSAVCAGGDAEVKVTLSQGGLPLAGRQVRFDVVSGDFRMITSSTGLAETLALSTTTSTDASGTARVRVRVLSEASSQTALLDIVDLGSGLTQRASFVIAPSSNAPLNAQPAAINFIGANASACASGIDADVIVFGGRPPYSISQPGTVRVTPISVPVSGLRFTVTATGQCTGGSDIAVVDANGATVTVRVTNVLGSNTPTPALVVAPAEVTLEGCNTAAVIAVAGGTGSYLASSGNNTSVQAFVLADTHQVQIQRRIPSPAVTVSPVTVAVSDGRTAQSVTVNLVGAALGSCP